MPTVSVLPHAFRAVGLLALAALAACGPAESEPSDAPVAPAASAPSSVRFVEATEAVGLQARHVAGIDEDYPMPAIMGGGFAVFDLEGDGDLDLYLVQSGERLPYKGAIAEGNRLLRNDPEGFVDVSEGSGAADTGYGQGVAVGDVDNDGLADLFVSNYGADTLLRNRGDGTFEDVTPRSGISGDGWSSSAVFVDVDGDGRLDLFVARYVDFDPARVCRLQSGRRDFCGPAQFQGLPDRLFLNRGDFRFEDVSRTAGIEALADRGLGVVAADFDGDGLVDLYVANDTDPNHLWINRGDGTFSEEGLLLGAAFNRFGVGEAGMGVSAGDVDGDGDPDLFVSHLIEETNTLYENLGPAGFEDVTSTVGLGVDSVGYTGFGTALADFDNDGRPDLAVVNGAVKQRPEPLVAPTGATWEQHDYAEPNQRFVNAGGGRFELAPVDDFSSLPEVSRGLLAADLDGDGDLDLLTSQIDGPLRFFRNETEAAGALSLRVLEYGRSAYGARLEVEVGGSTRSLLVQPLAGYLTSGDAPVHVGLADGQEVESLVVVWPDGIRETFGGGAAGETLTLRRGEGEAGP